MAFSLEEGIRQAEAEGRIIYPADQRKSEDMHTHLATEQGAIGGCNFRELDEQAALLLPLLPPKARILVLGHGFGQECVRIRNECPEAVIHSAALRPFNPYVAIDVPLRVLHKQVRETVGPETFEEYDRRTVLGKIRHMTKLSIESLDVPTELVEELQSTQRLDLFRTLDHPAADKQFIGKVFEEIQVEGPYDFIYEQEGPVSKSKTWIDGYPVEFGKALETLSPAGILYLTKCGIADTTAWCKSRERHAQPIDHLFIHEGDDQVSGTRMIAVAKGSPLYTIMSKQLENFETLKLHPQVYEVKPFAEFVKRSMESTQRTA
jgi:hypothetical protein